MATFRRRWRLIASLFCAALLGTGCNVLAVPYYLFGPESTQPADLRNLADTDKARAKEQDIVVVILADAGVETRPEFVRVDRELSSKLAQMFRESQKDKKKNKIRVVSVRDVEEFKSQTPGWKTLSPIEVGKKFGADWVIDLEVRSISMYERGSRELFQGRAKIDVTLVNVVDLDAEPERKAFSCEYPGAGRGPIPASESGGAEFRQAFINHIAQRLLWYFVERKTEEEFGRF